MGDGGVGAVCLRYHSTIGNGQESDLGAMEAIGEMGLRGWWTSIIVSDTY